MQTGSFLSQVAGQPVGPLFKDKTSFLDGLTPEDGTDRLSRNVDSYETPLRYVPEGRRPLYYFQLFTLTLKRFQVIQFNL